MTSVFFVHSLQKTALLAAIDSLAALSESKQMISASEMTIRDICARDVPGVVALVREVLAEFGLCFGEGSATDEEVTRLPASYVGHGGAFWVVADPSGVIVGTCGVFPLGDSTYELRKMYLSANVRGKGVARMMLDACLAFVRSRGGRRVVLDTTHQMERAIAFYERNGFVRDDSQIRGSRCSRGYLLELEAERKNL